MKKILISCILIALCTFSRAQQDTLFFNYDQERANFLNNLNLYGQSYLQNILDGYAYGQISGWQQTARVIRPASVRLEMVSTLTLVSPDRLMFSFSDQDFTRNFNVYDADNDGEVTDRIPTVLGGSADEQLEYTIKGWNSNDDTVTFAQRFDALDGITAPLDALPNVIPQISIGLPFDFEVTGRYFALNVSNFDVQILGLGLKHEISRYFVENDRFHVNIGGFFASTEAGYDLSDVLQGNDRQLRLAANSFNIDASASYTWKFLTAFSHVGYYQSAAGFYIDGTYEYETDNAEIVAGIDPGADYVVFDVTDPVSIEVDNAGMRFTAGVTGRLLKVLSLSTAYTFANYPIWNINMSINIATWEKKGKKNKDSE